MNARQVREIEEMQLQKTYEEMQNKIAEMKTKGGDLVRQVSAIEMEQEMVADTLYDHEELLEMFGVDLHAGQCSGKPSESSSRSTYLKSPR